MEYGLNQVFTKDLLPLSFLNISLDLVFNAKYVNTKTMNIAFPNSNPSLLCSNSFIWSCPIKYTLQIFSYSIAWRPFSPSQENLKISVPSPYMLRLSHLPSFNKKRIWQNINFGFAVVKIKEMGFTTINWRTWNNNVVPDFWGHGFFHNDPDSLQDRCVLL